MTFKSKLVPLILGVKVLHYVFVTYQLICKLVSYVCLIFQRNKETLFVDIMMQYIVLSHIFAVICDSLKALYRRSLIYMLKH